MARLRKESAASIRESTTTMDLGQHEVIGSYPWMAPGTFYFVSNLLAKQVFSWLRLTLKVARFPVTEIMKAGKYTVKADVYSLGVIIWEIMKGEEPWSEAVSTRAIERAVLSGRHLQLDGIPKEIALLLQRMWKLNPKKRPTAEEVVEELVAFTEKNDLLANVPAAASKVQIADAPKARPRSNVPTVDAPNSALPCADIGGPAKVALSSDTAGIPRGAEGRSAAAKRYELASAVTFFVAIASGIPFIVTDRDNSGLAYLTGAVFLVFTLIATPLAYLAARKYLSLRGTLLSQRISRCMKASWIIYTFVVLMGIISVAFVDSNAFAVCVFLLALIGWVLMMVCTEFARRTCSSSAAQNEVSGLPPEWCGPNRV